MIWWTNGGSKCLKFKQHNCRIQHALYVAIPVLITWITMWYTISSLAFTAILNILSYMVIKSDEWIPNPNTPIWKRDCKSDSVLSRRPSIMSSSGKTTTNLALFNSIDHDKQIKQLQNMVTGQNLRIAALEDSLKEMKLQMISLERKTANIEPRLAIESKRMQTMVKSGLSPRSGSSSPREQ